jgi:hypothetical protein
MPADDAAGRDLDDDRVSVRRKPSNGRALAPRSSERPLAGELGPPQTRSMTAAIAWPKPMHIVASP